MLKIGFPTNYSELVGNMRRKTWDSLHGLCEIEFVHVFKYQGLFCFAWFRLPVQTIEEVLGHESIKIKVRLLGWRIQLGEFGRSPAIDLLNVGLQPLLVLFRQGLLKR
jgi:hypothetical protein